MPVDMKTIIANTFMDLLRQGNVDKITVKQLIDVCHISRQTFYYHFQDITDVMEWTIRRQTARLLERGLQLQDMQAALQLLIASSVEQYPLMRKLLQSQRRSHLEAFMVESLRAYLDGLMRFHHQGMAVSQQDKELYLQYSACGLFGALLDNCGKDNFDQKRLAAQLEWMLTGGLSNLPRAAGTE